MSRPLIGITGRRFRLGLVSGVDQRFAECLGDNVPTDFARCVSEAAGLPVLVPFESATVDLVERVDGLIITGGQDVHPRHWGGDPSVVRGIDPRTDPSVHDEARDAAELALIRGCVEVGTPILGVCRGHQLINVAFGGTLIEDLPDRGVVHRSPRRAPFDGAVDHMVSFVAGSTAADIYGSQLATNSWHHQAVDRCGEGLVVTGRTADGVVEAIAMPRRPLLGVQWHPEWAIRTDPVFAWLVEQARRRSSSRPAASLDQRYAVSTRQ